MNLIHSAKVIQKKTEELRKKPAAKVLLVALFLCLILLSVLVKKGTENGASLQTAASLGADSSYGDRELPIYSVDTTENKVALSFDAAWGADDFQKIMDVLDAHNVKVTFFMTGGWIESYPECVKTLVEKGHDLGNHSEHHYDMASLSKTEQQEELMSAHEKVKELTGYEMYLFRPPYGSYNNSLINTAYECGYYPIQWSVDSLDWKDYGVDSIIKTVCEHKDLGPGAIILCHNGAKYTAQALDTLLTNLEQQGYEIVPISELILRENYHMDVTGKQIAN
jgi:polysaccharide deacetylase family sporulation protein PdaB